MKDDSSLQDVLVAYALGISVVIIVGLYHAYTMWCLWDWYLVSTGLPQLPFMTFVAVDFIISIITSHLRPHPVKDNWRNLMRIRDDMIFPTIALFVGWIMK